MNQIVAAAAILSAVIFGVMQTASSLSAAQAKAHLLDDYLSLSSEIGQILGSATLCQISMNGQAIDTADFTDPQPVRLYHPNFLGSQGNLFAQTGTIYGALKVQSLEVKLKGGAADKYLATLSLKVTSPKGNLPLMPKEFRLILGTAGPGPSAPITSCKTSESWGQLTNMAETCSGLGQLLAGFNPDGSANCQPGLKGPTGPQGSSGGGGLSGGCQPLPTPTPYPSPVPSPLPTPVPPCPPGTSPFCTSCLPADLDCQSTNGWICK